MTAVLLGAILTALSLAPASSAAQTQGSGSQAQEQEQVLVFTAGDSITGYLSAPATATAGPATIVFENSADTGNTTGVSHTLTFSTTRAGYNHDVDVNIFANPYDADGGRHEVQVNLSPGKYYYVCNMAGHTMSGELVVTEGGGNEDTTAPQVSAELSGDQNADGDYIGSAAVTLSASDSGSGVGSIEYEVDDTGFQPYTDPVTVDQPGDHSVQFRATDNAGNTSQVGSVSFTVVEAAPADTTAPQVTASVSGDQDADGGYVGSATVTLSASDTESGVAGIEYSLDGQSFTAYSAPVTVNEPGEHTLGYRATDNAGNTSDPQSVSFTVAEPAPADTTAPQVSAELSGDQNADGDFVGSATVALSASDAESGVAGMEYSLDGAPYADYAGPVAVNQPGEHTLSYRGTDNAGNTSDPQSVSFTVVEAAPADTTAPQVTASVSGDQDADGGYVGSATVTLSASDTESGVAGIEYSLDGQSFTAYSAPVTVNEPGEHTLGYRATDNAGNTSDPQSVSFTVAEAVPEENACPGSAHRDTVVIDGNDSGVANMDTGSGCTINELIKAWASYENHGAFVRHVGDVVNGPAVEGYLSGRDKAAIKSAAAKSDIGKPLELLDGKNPLEGWAQAGPGSFSLEGDGVIQTHGGMGLLWYEAKRFDEYVLHLDFRLTDRSNNSGIFVGFPDVGNDPWVAVREGEEVQINDNPGGDPQKTGAVYNEKPAERWASHPIGEWNMYDIVVRDGAITVYLNGTQVNHWVDDDPNVEIDDGYIGLQNHPPTSVQFRHVRVNEIGQ